MRLRCGSRRSAVRLPARGAGMAMQSQGRMGTSPFAPAYSGEMTLRRLAWWIYFLGVFLIYFAVLVLVGYLGFEAMRLGL